MLWHVERSKISGTIEIPPSKSHTIRALLISTLAHGKSTIKGALLEGDGLSALEAARNLGAKLEISGDTVTVEGINSDLSSGTDSLFLGNSGTSMNLFTSAAALGKRRRRFDGDLSLRSRPIKPLLHALEKLGAVFEIHQNSRDVPFSIQGPLNGGETTVSGISSQYLSSLLLSCPLIKNDTVIHVEDLHEKPYVLITLWWLERMGIEYSASTDLLSFKIKGNQRYAPVNQKIPGDFSSATFPAVAAAITDSKINIANLDFSDPQGDRGVFDILQNMGVSIRHEDNIVIVLGETNFHGMELDLNSMPDSLPAFSVLGCLAKGKTIIHNVKQARIKETDRIRVMTQELSKMGARIEERPDGIEVYNSKLKGCRVNGHNDHRVVMALALAGMAAEGETVIETAESAAVTYPTFAEDFINIGAKIAVEN